MAVSSWSLGVVCVTDHIVTGFVTTSISVSRSNIIGNGSSNNNNNNNNASYCLLFPEISHILLCMKTNPEVTR